MMAIIFWCSLAMVFYAYVGYPLLLLLWPFGRETRRGAMEPRISIVIAARNEAAAIEEKLRHLESLDYPAEKREIIVVSDGSTDDTARILAAWATRPGAIAIECTEARGKAYALNLALARATGEVVVFNDARQRLAPNALRALMANFADPRVGCASGELRFYTDDRPGRSATLYWKFERWLRARESRLGACMGATGAFYAIRREYFRPLPEGLILDDVFTPLQIALRGYGVIHDPAAVVFDHEATSDAHEFRRKVRTLAGNYQLLRYLPGLLVPRRTGFQFFSHKLARLLAPLFLLACLASSALAPGWIYRVAFAGQALCYAAAIYGIWRGEKAPVWAAAPAGVVMLNAAALVALFHFLSGKSVAWNK